MSNLNRNIKVICMEEEAFYALINEVMERAKITSDANQDKWISDIEAMEILRIKSKTTLQKLRDEGEIRFSQPTKKHILYDRQSLLDYLDRHARDRF